MKYWIVLCTIVFCVGCVRPPGVDVGSNANFPVDGNTNVHVVVNSVVSSETQTESANANVRSEEEANTAQVQERVSALESEPQSEDTQTSEDEVEPATDVAATNTATETKEDDENSEREQEATSNITVELQITPPGDSMTYTVSVPSGSTVEEAMQKAKDKGLTYTTKGYASLGVYVSAVNGLKEDRHAGMYWIYYYNGSRATAGITQQTLKKGDTVRWNYEHEF